MKTVLIFSHFSAQFHLFSSFIDFIVKLRKTNEKHCEMISKIYECFLSDCTKQNKYQTLSDPISLCSCIPNIFWRLLNFNSTERRKKTGEKKLLFTDAPVRNFMSRVGDGSEEIKSFLRNYSFELIDFIPTDMYTNEMRPGSGHRRNENVIFVWWTAMSRFHSLISVRLNATLLRRLKWGTLSFQGRAEKSSVL